MNSALSRAVVTGFCAAHPLLHLEPARWVEYSAPHAPHLRKLFGRIDTETTAEYSTVSATPWWERYFACGIIGELERTGWLAGGVWQTDPLRVAVCIATSKGRPAQLEKQTAYSFDAAPNWAARAVAQVIGARGKVWCPVAACASGAHAVALAAQWVEDDLCDVVVCGGIEAELAPMVLAGYRSLGALSTCGVMRPFDAKRDGFVPASGAACLILESEATAKRRGAHIHAQVAGWSLRCDATSQTAMAPSGETICRAIEETLQRSGVLAVDYVNAHGTATRQNDALEARAIEAALGHRVAVSSSKALTGHLLGAAGAVEAVLCLLAIEQGFAPPSLNLDEVDADCASINLLKNGREMPIEHALSLSYGFGGHIGVLTLQRSR